MKFEIYRIKDGEVVATREAKDEKAFKDEWQRSILPPGRFAYRVKNTNDENDGAAQ